MKKRVSFCWLSVFWGLFFQSSLQNIYGVYQVDGTSVKLDAVNRALSDILKATDFKLESVERIAKNARYVHSCFDDQKFLNRNTCEENELKNAFKSVGPVRLFTVLFNLRCIDPKFTCYALKTLCSSDPNILIKNFICLTERVIRSPSENLFDLLGKSLAILDYAFQKNFVNGIVNKKIIHNALDNLEKSRENALSNALLALLNLKEEKGSYRLVYGCHAFNALKRFSVVEKLSANADCFFRVFFALHDAFNRIQIKKKQWAFPFRGLEESDLLCLKSPLDALLKNIDFKTLENILTFSLNKGRSTHYDLPWSILSADDLNFSNDFSRVLKILNLRDAERLSNALSKAFDEATDDHELLLDDGNFETLQRALIRKIKNIELFFENRTITFAIFYVNKNPVSFHCSNRLLKFIMESVNSLPTEHQNLFIEKILPKPEDAPKSLELFSHYLSLTKTFFLTLPEELKKRVRSNLSCIFVNKEFKSFLVFKDLIDQERSENKLRDYDDQYKTLSKYLKFLNDLQKSDDLPDKQAALDFFDKNFIRTKEEDSFSYFLYLLETFSPEHYIKHLRSLNSFKMKKLNKALEEAKNERSGELKKEMNELDKIFESCGIDVEEFNSGHLKRLIDRDEKIEIDEISNFLKINDNEKLSQLLGKIEKFFSFYKNFIGFSSKIESIPKNFDLDNDIFYFTKNTRNFSDKTCNEFMNYLSTHYGGIQNIHQEVIEGEKIVSDQLKSWYKVLLGEINHSVQTEKFKKNLIQQEKSTYVLKTIPDLLRKYFYSRLSFGINPPFFLDEKKFLEDYYYCPSEENKNILDKFRTFCLKMLNNENFPREEPFIDHSVRYNFQKILKDDFAEHIKTYQKSDEYICEVSMHHPYTLLERFFKEAYLYSKSSKKGCSQWVNEGAKLLLMNINGYD
ncbi:hypothetical protein [Holospora undulata]|uniref:Uncharacterized protein n=1 Tax=Holospora undulata HU1 TaxID=1321371 RepID=A0A061JGX0_9PROT|nr:hypothetical protein [Holospora undulata]ETZ05401.1 hypothetical protein K737_300156 [Holospora undulata HU1]